MSQPQPQWFAGLDWASRSHRVRLIDQEGKEAGEKDFAHGGEGLAALTGWLLAMTEATPSAIHVAIETPHGPVVEALLDHGFAVHAINPKQLDRFRDRYFVAGAKDDSRDCLVLASALRTDRPAFRQLDPADPAVVELREFSRLAEELGVEHLALVNRLREQLWRYFPALLEVGLDPGSAFMLALWEAAPEPHKAARLTKARLERLLKRHRIRRIEAASLRALLQQQPLAVSAAAVAAACAHIRLLMPRLRLLARQKMQVHAKLDQLIAKLSPPPEAEQPPRQSDAAILSSVPGVGRVVLATLFAEAFDVLKRRDYQALRALCGVAPITKRSGKSWIVIRRQACHQRLANIVYHWARVAVQHDPVSHGKYAALRARGHSHGRALRSVADRLLNVACKILKTGVLFDANFKAQNTT